jgi:uncharacterized membrane protein
MNPAIARIRRHKAQNGAHSGQESQLSKSDEECVNVGEAERQASMVGGTILAVCGLLKGSMSGLALAAIGGALIYRGHTGHCQLYQALGHSTAEA